MKETQRNLKPRGKEEVMTAVLDAATALFAEKGGAAVSIRDIAERANVNHGLVHRHFGSKENLRLTVQHRIMEKINEDIGEPESYGDAVARLVHALRKNDAFVKLLTRMFLDETEEDVRKFFPFLRKMKDFVAEALKTSDLGAGLDPRILAAGSSAMSLGLLVFEKYLLPGTGLDDLSPAEAHEKILNTYMDLWVKKEKKIEKPSPPKIP
jgi:TetR/AcrR family transcriptional regulator, repressor for neighboring sulfatase